MSGDEETTLEELLRNMVWSRHRARPVLRHLSPSMFGAQAAVVAIVDDHDRRNPGAPAEGPDRVMSIVAHTLRLRQETIDHPERFTAAAGLEARRTGAPDPQLLARAGTVLGWLPAIATDTTAMVDAQGEVAVIDTGPDANHHLL